MTKSLLTGCINKEKTPSWRKFNLLLKTVDLDNRVSHVLVDDIHFDHKRSSAKHVLYNEVFPPIIEKHKIIDPSKRSVYHLLEQYSETDKGIPRSYRAPQKAHATLFSKKIQPLFLGHLRFLIFRVGWVVTKICSLPLSKKDSKENLF